MCTADDTDRRVFRVVDRLLVSRLACSQVPTDVFISPAPHVTLLLGDNFDLI